MSDNQELLLLLEDQVSHAVDLLALVELTANIEELRQGLSILEKEAKAKIAMVMEGKEADVGDWHVERRMSVSRKNWDHKMIFSKIVTAAMERDEDPSQAVLNTATITGWRLGESRRLGVNPDEFCDVVWGSASAILRRRTPHEGNSTEGRET